MTSDEDTDPHASAPPPSLSSEQQFEDTLRNLLKDELRPIVNIQLAADVEHKTLTGQQKVLDERVTNLERTRFILPIAISTAALVVAVISLVLSVRNLPLGLW